MSVLVPMSMTRDAELLKAFVRDRSQPAFSELVARHIDMIYASARRQTRDPGLAEDVSQAVFLLLSRKAASLRPDVLLAGWLMTATWYACNNLRRQEKRRKMHEAQAAQLNHEAIEEAQSSSAIEPVLDLGLSKLNATDRAAVSMHYLQGESFAAVAAALKTTPEGARKRIERAVQKLRMRFAQSGIEVTPAVVAAGLQSAAQMKAPAGLADKVGVTASAGAAAIAAGALAMMGATKAKLAALTLVGVVAVAGVVILLPVLLGSSSSNINQQRRIMTDADATAPRDALIKLAAAVRAGDGDEARKYADTSDPAYQPFLDQAAESIRLSAQFKRSFRRIFGDAAADALPEFVRPENVPGDAPVTIAGDRATVSLPTPNAPTVKQMNLGAMWDVSMVKVAGAWKVQVQSIQWWNQTIPLTPDFAAELARMNNDVCRRAIDALEAGQFAKPEEARKFFGDGVRASLKTIVDKWQASTQSATTKPSGQ